VCNIDRGNITVAYEETIGKKISKNGNRIGMLVARVSVQNSEN